MDAESAHVLCHSLLALAGMSGRVVCPEEITLGADHWLVFSASIAILYVAELALTFSVDDQPITHTDTGRVVSIDSPESSTSHTATSKTFHTVGNLAQLTLASRIKEVHIF